MKRIISMLICCLVFAGVQAQKITREYNNVSLSEALRQLNEQTEDYTISFLYNELEDFRITTSIHRKTVPDAIRQMIGFYPIRMTVEPGIANPSQQEIIVECPHRRARPARSLRQHRPALAPGLHADYRWRVERERSLRHSL